jgi:ribosomal-protein-serine acetyltransferase
MVTVPERLANNGRFELLPVHAGCVAELFEAVAESKNEISPWMEWCDADYSIEATKQWVDSRSQAWEQDKEYGFLIVDARSKQVLGTCGINQVHATYRFANLGYWIRTSRTRECAATEAIRLLAQFGFSTLQLVRIEIVVAAGNLASQKGCRESWRHWVLVLGARCSGALLCARVCWPIASFTEERFETLTCSLSSLRSDFPVRSIWGDDLMFLFPRAESQ